MDESKKLVLFIDLSKSIKGSFLQGVFNIRENAKMDESKKLADDFEFIRARMNEISFEKEQVWGRIEPTPSRPTVYYPDYDATKTFTGEQKKELATTFGCRRANCYYSTSHRCYLNQKCCLDELDN